MLTKNKTFINDLKLLIWIPISAMIFYIINEIIIVNLNFDASRFIYKLLYIHACFALVSTLLVGSLIVVKTKNLDIVGMTFLVLTSLKMIFAYLTVRPLLSGQTTELYLQKMNFLSIFILYLAIETVIMIRILNNK